MSRFRTLRGRLTTIAVLVAAVAMAVLIIGFNIILSDLLHGDVDSRLRAHAAEALTVVDVVGDRVVVNDRPDDTTLDRAVWIYQGRTSRQRPQADARIQAAADGLVGRAGAFTDVAGQEYRLHAVPIMAHGRQIGTLVAGQSLAAYDRSTDVAQAASLALGVLVLLAIGILTWTIVGRALGPVRAMTWSAAQWSEHEPQRRFGGGERPGELGDLARTFNGLMDRVAASLRHEQLLSAELSHELRTPLARIVAEIELLQRRDRTPEARAEAYASIARSAGQMNDILETLMAAARADARLDHGRSDLVEVLEDLPDVWVPVSASRGVRLDVDVPARPLPAGVAAEVVQRMLAPLLDNAVRHARSTVRVTTSRRPGAVVVSITDDGPGVPESQRERIFDPGVRVAAQDDPHPGAGLGLALARRLARAVGGDVALEPPDGDLRGAHFALRLPA